ncbi:MAG: ATP-binding cassette domain-containing protein [Gammaproteobacteria bacterium]|nr:ATP-binding cassette domain-containing protein [Gammaproteobacteria bacterium]
MLVTKKSLLEAVSFVLAKDECICLSGPSGSGKTLLLRAISDLDEHEGNVYLEEKECRQYTAPNWRKQVGLLTAENYWWHDRIGSHFHDESDTQLIANLSQLGLDKSILTADVNHCSTGEKQRLALLRLLQNNPKVLLLDEPTSSMDPDSVRRVEKFLTEFRHQHQTSILWISHDPQQIKRIADKHLQIQNGKLIEGPVA